MVGKLRTYQSLRGIAGLFFSCIIMQIGAGCSDDKKETLDLTIYPETTPTMLTHNVSTLISDSGITRYHITAPVWYVYGESSNPKWTFPDGVFLEKFDNNLKQEATVECDSATYFENQHLWRLDGNVRIKNIQNEKFLTQQLFWDQRQQKVYSDSFIHIERQDRIIEGYGFTSDDRLSEYVVNRVSGIFPVSQFTGERTDAQDASTAHTSQAVTTSVIDGQDKHAVDPEQTETISSTDSVVATGRRASKMRRQRHRNDSTSSGVDISVIK